LKKTNKEGFTIIEVMIVLAIAALILLIVFLAVPALQRTARNTSRKTDASAVSAAISNYTTNNSNTGPTSTPTLVTALEGVKLGYYTPNPATTAGPVFYATVLPTTYATTNGGTGSATTVTTEDMVFMAGATCNAAGKGTVTGASPRDFIILYEVETGSAPTPECIST
jgi:prepilin-type N-terminal cleavage/methylation domain-containing protein